MLGLRFSVRGLSPVAASGDHSSSRCAGLSLSWPLLLRSTGSRRAGSVTVAHGPSCSAACGLFPDQGSNPCPLHWQADSQPLRHQGSPRQEFYLGIHYSKGNAQLFPPYKGNKNLSIAGSFWAAILSSLFRQSSLKTCLCLSTSLLHLFLYPLHPDFFSEAQTNTTNVDTLISVFKGVLFIPYLTKTCKSNNITWPVSFLKHSFPQIFLLLFFYCSKMYIT